MRLMQQLSSIVTVAIALCPIIWAGGTDIAIAANIVENVENNQIWLAQRPEFKTPGVGVPGQRKDTGSRGCPSVEKPLIALIPDTNIGLTRLERPTFWFYVPYPGTRSVEFFLETASGETLYETSLSYNYEPGIIGLQLPEDMVLEEGKSYVWVFNYICDPNSRSDDKVVYGEVMRVEPDSDYVENGLWYEALAELATKRLAASEDVSTDWRRLLEIVSLPELIEEPVVGVKELGELEAAPSQ